MIRSLTNTNNDGKQCTCYPMNVTHQERGSSITSPEPNVSAIHSAASETYAGVKRTYLRGEKFEEDDDEFRRKGTLLEDFLDMINRRRILVDMIYFYIDID